MNHFNPLILSLIIINLFCSASVSSGQKIPSSLSQESFRIGKLDSDTSHRNATIVVPNPGPRVGDVVDVDLIINKNLSSDYSVNDTNKIASASIQLYDVTQDTGCRFIGPLTFKIGTRVFCTDSLQIKVYPKITLTDSSFIIRSFKINGKQYLISEQMLHYTPIRNQQIDSNELNPYNFPFEYIEPDYDTLPYIGIDSSNLAKGLSIGSTITNYGSGNIRHDNDSEKPVEYQSMLKVYIVKEEADYNGKFVLRQNNFTHVPKWLSIEPVPIH